MPILQVSDPDDYARFGEVFARAGYTEEALAKTFGPARLPTQADPDLPHFLRRTRGGSAQDTLVRLFLLGVPVELAAAGAAFAPVPLERWLEAGLIRLNDGTAVATVRLLLFRKLLLASDPLEGLEPGAQFEQVMGITASTTLLADFAVRRPAADTLDMGTGNGIQAFLAARHSRRVSATDRGVRCLQFARFNAGLNGIRDVEFLQGDTFEPVRGRQFDLVLSNLPFFITPSQRYLYRDSGLGLDRFAEQVVRQVPALLRQGGICQLTFDWVHLAGQPWQERLACWFRESGCDAWVIRVETYDPAEYAQAWVSGTEHVGPEEAARLYEEWVDYYERERIEAISSGLVMMRRNAGAGNWLRIEDQPEAITPIFGDYVLLGCELRDYLEHTGDDALLDECLLAAPGTRLVQQYEPGERGWRIASTRIRLARGLEYASNIDRRLVSLVGDCDGRRPLRELVAELAARAGASPEHITPNCLKLVRQLVERGFLLPPGLRAPE